MRTHCIIKYSTTHRYNTRSHITVLHILPQFRHQQIPLPMSVHRSRHRTRSLALSPSLALSLAHSLSHSLTHPPTPRASSTADSRHRAPAAICVWLGMFVLPALAPLYYCTVLSLPRSMVYILIVPPCVLLPSPGPVCNSPQWGLVRVVMVV